MEQYYKAEENGFVLPQEGDIKAIKNDYKITAKTSEKKVKHFKLKYTAAIAACMAVVMGMTLFINVFNKKDKPHEYSDGIRYIDSVSEWFDDEALDISVKMMKSGGDQIADGISSKVNGSSQISFLSSNTGKVTNSDTVSKLPDYDDSKLPSWVNGVNYYNARYGRLYCVGKEAIYDFKKGEIVDINQKLYDILGLNFTVNSSWANYMRIGYYRNTDWLTVYLSDSEKLYMVNPDEEIYKELKFELKPNSFEDCGFAISDDFVHVMYKFTRNYKEYYVYYNTNTGESYLLDITPKEGTNAAFKLGTNVTYTPDGKYAIIEVASKTYGKDTSEIFVNNEFVYPYYAEWFIYDIEDKQSWFGEGQIVRYTKNGDAIVVKTPDGNKVLSLEGLVDVTETYELEPYELYELRKKMFTDENNSTKSFTYYLAPLFGGKEIVIAENVRSSYTTVNATFRWSYDINEYPEFMIFHCWGSKDLLMYSFTRNEMCELKIDGSELDSIDYYSITPMLSLDEKKLTLLVWTNSKSAVTANV